MKSWDKIYTREIEKAGGAQNYLRIRALEKEPLIRKIIQYAKNDGKILEAGCGTGALSTYLSNLGFEVVGIDINEKMLELARKISAVYPCQPKFEKHDLFQLPFPPNFFDVTFSHGVLEHFSDMEIVKILDNELHVSKIVIASMPSNYFTSKEKIFGDERFLTTKKWKSLIKKTRGEIIEIFSFHYLKGLKKFWDIILHKRFSGPGPYLTFVLKKKD